METDHLIVYDMRKDLLHLENLFNKEFVAITVIEKNITSATIGIVFSPIWISKCQKDLKPFKGLKTNVCDSNYQLNDDIHRSRSGSDSYDSTNESVAIPITHTYLERAWLVPG